MDSIMTQLMLIIIQIICHRDGAPRI